MAQTNYTPIILYNSGTTTNAPSASNLASGELAINYTDGKLFYKDNSSAIQVIGWKTTPTTAGGTGLTSYTAGDLPYYASGSTLSKLGIGTSGYVLQSNGSAPTWVAQSTLTVGNATNAVNVGTTDNTSSSSTYYPTLVSATSGNNPITTSSTKLSFVPSTGTLTATSHAGAWAGSTIGTTYGGTGLTSFTANGVVYASSTSALATSSAITFNSSGQLQVNTSGQPSLLLTNTTLNSASTSGTTGLYLGDVGSGVNVLTREKVTANTAYARIYAEQGYSTASLCASFYNTVAYQGNNSTVWSITSDERVKTNIRPTVNALEKNCALNAVHFEYKNAIGKIKTSFIAQEVEAVLPGHVHEVPAPDDLKQYVGEDGMMKALDTELIPYLVSAIKELSTQVTTLQATVTTLQTKVT